MEDYDVKLKIPGAVKKSLASDPIFISDYSISNALRMKGSEKNGNGAVFSEVYFGGVPQDKFQAMVEELYQHFQDELAKSGFNITDGDKLLQSDYAIKQKENDKHFIGKTGKEPYSMKAKITEGAIPGYGALFVKEGISFRPVNKNTYVGVNIIGYNFYQKLATQENTNILAVGYNITFAGFDGSRGFNSARLETSSELTINPVIMLINPKGAFSFISMEKGPIMGNNDWSMGVKETDLNKLEYFGLATSAKYAIQADPDKYVSEVKAIIMNYQTDMVKALKAELN